MHRGIAAGYGDRNSGLFFFKKIVNSVVCRTAKGGKQRKEHPGVIPKAGAPYLPALAA